MNKKKFAAIISVVLVIVAIITFVMIKTSIANSKAKREQAKIEETINEEGIETDIEFSDDTKEESDVRFPDKREFTQEELENEEEPEGADFYEIDEQESPYTVYVENIAEMADEYNDITNCMNLKYYMMVYLRQTVGNYDERYVATLVKDSCVNSDQTTILTVDATVDKYPDIIFHIEYDKVNRVFGINSELGDFSLNALKKESKINMLEFDPEIAREVTTDNVAPVTTMN